VGHRDTPDHFSLLQPFLVPRHLTLPGRSALLFAFLSRGASLSGFLLDVCEKRISKAIF